MTLRPADLGVTTQNRIGRSQYNDPYLNARMDDFRLYAGALSSTDIAALASLTQPAGLVLPSDSTTVSGLESATPTFVITLAAGENPASAKLTTATSVAGHSYQLQSSTSLASGSWQNVGDPLPGNGSPLVFETPFNPDEPRRFYRILIAP